MSPQLSNLLIKSGLMLLISIWFLSRGIVLLRGYLMGKGARYYYWKWYENWNQDMLGQKIGWYAHYRTWLTGIKWVGLKVKPNPFERLSLLYIIVFQLFFGTVFLGVVTYVLTTIFTLQGLSQ